MKKKVSVSQKLDLSFGSRYRNLVSEYHAFFQLRAEAQALWAERAESFHIVKKPLKWSEKQIEKLLTNPWGIDCIAKRTETT